MPELLHTINNALDDSNLPKNMKDGRFCYQLGRIIIYRDYMLLVFSHFENNQAKLSQNQYEACLRNMWNEVSIKYANKPISLPLLGGGITRFTNVSAKKLTFALKLVYMGQISEIQDLPKAVGLLASFAELLGTKVENHRVVIPPQYGNGYTALYEFNEDIAMMINNHVLRHDVFLKAPKRNLPKNRIFFRFQNIISNPNIPLSEKNEREIPLVQVSTMGLNSEIFVPSNTHRAHINIVVKEDYLQKLITRGKENTVVQNILQNNQQLLFEHIVHPSLQKIADEIVSESIDEPFEMFFYRIKAEELICRLLIELGKRDDRNVQSLNTKDLQMIFKVKEYMLQHLSSPQTIESLSEFAGMSPSKLKRLFKQVFGKGVFSYFQEFRIKKAAQLLKEERLSVSEVGYKLGFSNLSHFTRVFEEQIGMKPKQFSKLD